MFSVETHLSHLVWVIVAFLGLILESVTPLVSVIIVAYLPLYGVTSVSTFHRPWP